MWYGRRMPTLELPSGTVAYEDRGDGPPVVLLPAGAHTIRDYDALRELLPGMRTIAIDWPSHGDSPPSRTPASAMAGFLRRIYPAFSARHMRARTDADRAARQRAIATTRDPAGLAAVAGLWASFASPEHDLRAQARGIAAPTLALWGRRDPVIPAKVGRTLADAIPGAQLVLFDTGHAPQVSDPTGVAAALVPFLEQALR